MIKKCSILLLAFVLIFGGCSYLPGTSGTSAGKIIPPQDGISPFEGKWTVLEELGAGENTESAEQQWMGSNVQFAEDRVALGEALWDEVSYKIKRVSTSDYLMSKYMPLLDFFDEGTKEVEVVTVYAAENYLGEAMKFDDSNMIFFVQDTGLVLEKVSDQADSMLNSSVSTEQNLIQGGNERTSGVLLGLRIPGAKGDTYRTLWIAADHGQMHPVLMSESLFFPRTSGFWELDVTDVSAEGEKGNILSARNVGARALEEESVEEESLDGEEYKSEDGDNANEDMIIDSSEKIIEYIGNDYITVEKKADGLSRLMVLPVDNLSSSAEIKISDLLGEKGLDSLLSVREQAESELRGDGIRLFARGDSGGNFGLTRQNGHWILVGRVNYQGGETPDHTDFDIKTVPPISLVSYDTLVLSWPKIKDRVPDALDAFTSPNKDIALVQTKNKLTIYRIGAEQLAKTPLAELDVPENVTVIMAEWATGSYVESWGNSFLTYGAEPLSGDTVRIR